MKKFIKVEFDNSYKQYVFNCDQNLELTKFDRVVVDTINGLQVAVVVDVLKENEISFNGTPTRWVIDKIDEQKISQALVNAERLEMKKELDDLMERVGYLQAKLDEK